MSRYLDRIIDRFKSQRKKQKDLIGQAFICFVAILLLANIINQVIILCG